ncbi:MAG: DUF4113 domain-containing protein, partial [Proteobacteria bacterium]
VGQRLLNELRGVPAIRWEFEQPAKKNITHSRSFGYLLTRKEDIAEALSNYAANVAEKLRAQRSHCRSLNVFIQTNPHRIERPQYLRSIDLQLASSSNATPELIKYALKGLDLIFKDGFEYMKAGIIASDLISDRVVQKNLFDMRDDVKNAELMAAMDKVNKQLGKDVVRMAVQGFTRSYKLRADHLSKKYTTDINQVLSINNK